MFTFHMHRSKALSRKTHFYYKALRRTQSTLRDATADWEPCLGFFLRNLKKQTTNLSATIQYEKINAAVAAATPTPDHRANCRIYRRQSKYIESTSTRVGASRT